MASFAAGRPNGNCLLVDAGSYHNTYTEILSLISNVFLMISDIKGTMINNFNERHLKSVHKYLVQCLLSWRTVVNLTMLNNNAEILYGFIKRIGPHS